MCEMASVQGLSISIEPFDGRSDFTLKSLLTRV